MWFIYTREYYSAIKRNEIVSFEETWIDLEMVIQNEISQGEKNKYCIISLICGIQKNGTNELICKAEIETKTQRTNLRTPRGERRNGMDWEIGTDIYTLLGVTQITNENLLHTTGNSAQSSVVNQMGSLKKEGTYKQLIRFAIQQKLTEHCKELYSNKKLI